jgi:hypothetical protein
MPSVGDVYLEVGAKRVFAGALDWPGWCRSGRDQEHALQALIDYAKRYAASMGAAARGFKAPTDTSELRVAERVKGNATTDFGVPAIAPKSDTRAVSPAEARRLASLLKASWSKFDRAADAASGVRLRKGPRGGGRTLDAVVRHVLEADGAYLYRLGGKHQKPNQSGTRAEMSALRKEIMDLLAARSRGETPSMGRRTAPLWTPRYFVRRAVWHALDHAWEIEDRATN